jgi:hypothetical protein
MKIFPVMYAAKLERKVAKLQILSDWVVPWTLPLQFPWQKITPFWG